ncbi:MULTISPECIES: type IV toxin-antitoxin system AbiEi family antitoxin domain-containing protein [unclassified Microbacterium]|uniref:type IV toxin-antitoxin system AbiEi family antitoxin domain-containing protein n=1 Tax=unclassified Microbacterium TaxID=2609290 RepID=UPI0037C8E6A8
MRAVDALETLELLGSAQWGLVTTSQARSAGLTNVQLARLADRGTLYRVRHGVYALPSAGADPLQDLRAAWLAAGRDDERVVVSGASAAAVHGLGDLVPSRHEFTSAERRQSAQADVRFHRATLPDADVVVVDGLPVTSVERTVQDLSGRALDADHLATVLEDAVTRSHANPRKLASALERNAHRYHSPSGARLLASLAPASAPYWAAVAKSLADGATVQVSPELREGLALALTDAWPVDAVANAFAGVARSHLGRAA